MKIGLISTGGTIASRRDQASGLLMAGEQTGEELLEQCDIASLSQSHSVHVHSYLQVPSNCMSFEQVFALKQFIQKLHEEDGYEAFVVTHGTDTLEESCFLMDLIWDQEAPIIFTGAQISPTESNTDAFANMRHALLLAASPESARRGALICFDGQILPAKDASKVHTASVRGFAAPYLGPMGVIDRGRVRYFAPPAPRKAFACSGYFPKVAIVQEHLDIDPQVYAFHAEHGAKGIIIEGYGRGHSSVPSAKAIDALTKKGVQVVVTSRCLAGEVAPVYGYIGSLQDLMQRGALDGSDFKAKKARILLMLMLANEYTPEAMQDCFSTL